MIFSPDCLNKQYPGSHHHCDPSGNPFPCIELIYSDTPIPVDRVGLADLHRMTEVAEGVSPPPVALPSEWEIDIASKFVRCAPKISEPFSGVNSRSISIVLSWLIKRHVSEGPIIMAASRLGISISRHPCDETAIHSAMIAIRPDWLYQFRGMIGCILSVQGAANTPPKRPFVFDAPNSIVYEPPVPDCKVSKPKKLKSVSKSK